jgi:hypothetical protein
MDLNLKEMSTQSYIRKQTIKFLSEKLFNNVGLFLKNIFRCKWKTLTEIMVLINSECITSWNDQSKRIRADQYSESLVRGFLKRSRQLKSKPWFYNFFIENDALKRDKKILHKKFTLYKKILR